MSQKTIEVTDVILRDAHQSLMATRLSMEDMIPSLEDLDNAGYWSLECWGGATFDSCMRFLNEDPWERLRTFKKHLKKTPLQMLFRAQNILGYRHYGDDVVRKFVEKSAENGMNVFRIFDALNDPRNLECAIGHVKKLQEGGADVHAQGTISYTVSPVHTVEKYVELATQLKDMGVDSICIKDMAALIKPQHAYDLVSGIKKACGDDMRLHLHVHATTGVTLVSIMKAIEAGLDNVDTSLSAMCLGTGHNPTESFAEMLEDTPFTHKLDMDRVNAANLHFKDIPARYQEFYTSFTGVATKIFDSQIPGGMLSNMESQLKQQGAGDRMDEVLLEVPRVRKAAGYPPLVTPSSQIVGTQAVFNVLMGKWKKLTGEFQDLMLGYYGKTTTDYDPDIVAIAQEQSGGKAPITCRPADQLDNEFDKLAADATKLEGFNGSDEDVLTFALFPNTTPKFFIERPQGPKNLGKDPVAAESAATTAPAPVAPTSGPRDYTVTVDGQAYNVSVAQGANGQAAVQSATPVAAASPAAAPATSSEALPATLAGTVLRMLKQPGEQVAADEAYMVLEAMKMETEVSAPRAGTIVSFAVQAGQQVAVGDTLATLA